MDFLIDLILLPFLIVSAICTLGKLGKVGQQLGELQTRLLDLRIQLRELEDKILWGRPSPASPIPPLETQPLPTPGASPNKQETKPGLKPTTGEPSLSRPDKLPPAPRAVAAPSSPVSPPPLPQAALTPQAPAASGAFENSVRGILNQIWNWIVVGEEHRPQGVALEFAVASTWLLRLGVMILVIGVGFFLKDSLSRGLFGPLGRIAFTTLAGAGLVGGGWRLFGSRYAVLGQGLMGAGIATLYFSFFTAQQPDYQLLGPVAAFALMVLVTLVAGVVAVRQNSLLVAILGLIGGYGTPWMIRSPEEGVVLSFFYLLLLGIGILFIAAKQNWRLLHYLGFAATTLHMGQAIFRHYHPHDFWTYQLFLLAYFALFSSISFVYQIRHRQPSSLLELIFLFLNAATFTGYSLHCLDERYPQEAKALLTLGLALFYLLHIGLFLKRRLQDRGLLLSFQGLASFYVALTLPLVLSHGWITVSWALQAFVMLGLASKLRSKFLRQLAYLLYLGVLGRLTLLDLPHAFESNPAMAFSGKAYARAFLERLCTCGLPIGSFFAAGRLFPEEESPPSTEPDEESPTHPSPLSRLTMGRIGFWIAVALGFVYLNLETLSTLKRFFDPLLRPSLTLLWIGFGAFFLHQSLKHRSKLGHALLLVLSAALVMKVFFYDTLHWSEGGILTYATDKLGTTLGLRVLNYGAVLLAFVQVARHLAPRAPHSRLASLFAYTALAGFFLYSSLEIHSALVHFLPAFRMGGLSLYWSVFALTLILSGLLKNCLAFRAMGLALLSVTVLKVFLADLAGLETHYRIFAFLGLGVMVLAGSFLYFKYSHRFTPAVAEDSEESPD